LLQKIAPSRHPLPATEGDLPVQSIRTSWFALGVLVLLATPASTQTTGSYTAPAEFMDLFFDFTGSNEPGYPAGQPTLGQMLTQSVVAKESARGAPGPLVLAFGSDIYVYESTGGALLSREQFRADRASGFFEMTAISHIGPALAYLAQIRANGDTRWRTRLASLRTHTAQVRALNQRAANNWLDLLNQPAWSTHKAQIRNMVDYACARTLSYIDALGNGDGFTVAGVNDDLFNGTSAQYPIPFVNVMIGTFMLEALRGAADVHDALAALKLDWPHAMVLVSSRAGSNVSSGDQLAGAVPEGGIRVHPARRSDQDRPLCRGAPFTRRNAVGAGRSRLLRAEGVGPAVLPQGRFRSGVRRHPDHLPAGPPAAAGTSIGIARNSWTSAHFLLVAYAGRDIAKR
jgi:hypothetical protein